MIRTSFHAAAGADTLLAYQAFTRPDPLQAGAAGAILTLVASNPGRRAVTVRSLVVTLPVGTTAHDLTPDASGVQVQVPQGWTASASAGVVTLLPQGGAGEVGPSGLSFVLASLNVNGEVGTATLVVDETAFRPGQPAADRAAAIPLPKFPTPARVIPLTVVGGAGGPGGNGGSDFGLWNWSRQHLPPCSGGGAGGNGGPGGNATLDVTFSAGAGAPAQYLVSIAAGAGGFPGGHAGSGVRPAAPGEPGPPGTVTMTFDGIP